MNSVNRLNKDVEIEEEARVTISNYREKRNVLVVEKKEFKQSLHERL